MSEKPLLQLSANTGTLAEKSFREKIWFFVMAFVGIVMILIGAADVSARISRSVFGNDAAFMAFAPAVMLLNNNATTSPTAALAAHSGTATTSPIVPALLTVPSIGVKANVEQVGKKDDGSMGTPQKFDDVAWYTLGSKPGEPGNAVIDGHVNNALTKAGVFEHLTQLKVGDPISVADVAGNTLSYKVVDIEEYPADTAPTASIFSQTGPSQLVLITCDGDWVPSDKSFSNRLVVFAALQ